MANGRDQVVAEAAAQVEGGVAVSIKLWKWNLYQRPKVLAVVAIDLGRFHGEQCSESPVSVGTGFICRGVGQDVRIGFELPSR